MLVVVLVRLYPEAPVPLKYKPEIDTELLRLTALFTAEALNQATSPAPGGAAPLTIVQLPAVLKSEPVLFQSVSPSGSFGVGAGVGDFFPPPLLTVAEGDALADGDGFAVALAEAEGAGLAVAEGDGLAVGFGVGAGVGVGFAPNSEVEIRK